MRICEQSGISPSKILNALGLSKGALAYWKTGGAPLNETKKKIADYMGITVKELVSGEAKEPTKKEPDREAGLSDIDMEIVKNFRRLTEEQQRLVLAQVQAWLSID